MPGKSFKDAINDAKRRVQAAIGKAEGGTVNVTGRTNVARSVNVGGKGSQRSVSSKQRVRIRQNGEESYEESETTETVVERGDVAGSAPSASDDNPIPREG
jgi:hypothetical protein